MVTLASRGKGKARCTFLELQNQLAALTLSAIFRRDTVAIEPIFTRRINKSLPHITSNRQTKLQHVGKERARQDGRDAEER